MEKATEKPVKDLLRASLPAAFITIYLFNLGREIWSSLSALAGPGALAAWLVGMVGQVFMLALLSLLQFIVALPAMIVPLVVGYHAIGWLQKHGHDGRAHWLAAGAAAGLSGVVLYGLLFGGLWWRAEGLYTAALFACAGMLAAHNYRQNIISRGHYN